MEVESKNMYRKVQVPTDFIKVLRPKYGASRKKVACFMLL